jgi:hypothetical protein
MVYPRTLSVTLEEWTCLASNSGHPTSKTRATIDETTEDEREAEAVAEDETRMQSRYQLHPLSP